MHTLQFKPLLWEKCIDPNRQLFQLQTCPSDLILKNIRLSARIIGMLCDQLNPVKFLTYWDILSGKWNDVSGKNCQILQGSRGPHHNCQHLCSSKQCPVLHAINDLVWIHICCTFSDFLTFLVLIFEKKTNGTKSIKTGSGCFHTLATADCYTSPSGEKNRRRSKRNHCFWVHNIIKQRFEHSAYHSFIQKLQLEYGFSQLSFITIASILEPSIAVATSPTEEKQTTTKGRNADHTHFPLEGLCGSGGNCSMKQKKICNAELCLLFHYRTAWKESDIHTFFVPVICHHCCHFGMYGVTPLVLYKKTPRFLLLMFFL